MFKKAFLVIGGLVGVLLVVVALKPDEMHIARELLIEAPPEAIFPYINSNRKANEWMPWQEVDPSVTMEYIGPEEGIGSISKWNSSGKMGVGQAEVVESVQGKLVKTKLSYTKPMEMSQLAEVSLTPHQNGTIVRWSVTGKNSFLGRLMCMVMNMDKEVGGQFEKGLNKLKSIVIANKAQ